jgi:fatty-acid desaturase
MPESTLGSSPTTDANASATSTPTVPLAPEHRLHPDVTAYVDDAGLIQDPILSAEAEEKVVAKKVFDPTDPNQLPPGKTPFLKRFPRGICWPVTLWMAGMHIGAIAAFWFISWQALATFLALHFVTACLGITLGYHRLLTHGSFQCPSVVRYFFSICGMLSAEGSPLEWVATHRKHHVHSDHDDDPHSPLHGFWWAHMLWFYPAETEEQRNALFLRWAPDLYRDPVQQFFHKTFAFYPIILGVVLYAVGEYAIGGLGLSMVLWGLCARMVAAYHSTWFVNSATHMWGYTNYQTTDKSKNNWWVALLSYGEGWHNNHHAHQRLAAHGHRWWEFDVTWNMIKALRFVGLAWKVQDNVPLWHNHKEQPHQPAEAA